MSTKKDAALAAIDDLVSDFLYYDRKEDEELSVEDLGALLAGGALTVDEIVERFRAGMVKNT